MENVQPHSDERWIPRLVEEQAAIRPNALAIGAPGESVTYGTLNQRAEALAIVLRAAGVRRDALVAICIPNSISMIVGALGILKAGGAYLPLDPAYPAQRLSFILNDAGVRIVLSSSKTIGSVPQGEWTIIDIDAIENPNGHSARAADTFGENPRDLAYVIYTSGSTGQPKGVEVEHSSLLNLVNWHQKAFEVSPDDRATQIAGVGFDAAVWEIWPYLTAGASIHIPDATIRTEPYALRDWLIEENITISFVPTALAERMMKLEWPPNVSLRKFLTGADTLHHFPSPSLPFAVVNNYGPTECTVVATSGVVPSQDSSEGRPSIGKPILNTRVYILDEKLSPVPAGTAGEIYLAGAGLARGYRNRQDLTASRFIDDPFVVEGGGRMYRTGDRGCMMPNGEIAFLGRIDDQIKIRGYRIEPNEIVAALNQHPAIAESAVTARETAAGDVRLVAYIIPAASERISHSELQEFLRVHLPEYMVPSAFVRMERLPLTTNGKVDRAALPEPTSESVISDDVFAAPRSAVEERVAKLLTDLLQVERIGVKDNFFHLGGHSLLGAQVISRVRDIFDVELSLRAIFDHPTVQGMSAEIEQLILSKLGQIDDEETENIAA